MRRPAFCICENKDADQLRGNREADQYYIVILLWPVGSRMLHQNTTVIRRATTVRTERGVRLTVCQGDVS